MLDWRPSTWGDEIALEYGKAIRGYQEASGKYRVFGTNGPVGWTDDALAPGPGVILGRKGAYRGVHFSEQPFWVIDTAYYVRPLHDGLDMRWLYYAIQFHQLGSIDDGSPIPSTTRAAVYVRDLDVPELKEQRAIASVLASIDEKIELNRRMNDTLEALAQAIFKDWFVDFGPTRRKIHGVTDPVAILGGLTSDPAKAAALAALFPDSFGEDGLPDGWEEQPLEKTITLQRGFDLPKTDRTDGHFPVIAASGPKGTHNEFKVKGPGVCTGRSGVLGGVFFVKKDFWPLNTSLWVKDYPNATPLYAFYLLKTLDLHSLNAGSAVPTLNRNHVHKLQVPTPRIAVVLEFEKLASTLYDKIDACEVENHTLAETRDYLLPQLMSGAARVRDVEVMAE